MARDQADCDFIRSTEVQSPGKHRFGVAGYSEDLAFVRVQRIEGSADLMTNYGPRHTFDFESPQQEEAARAAAPDRSSR